MNEIDRRDFLVMGSAGAAALGMAGREDEKATAGAGPAELLDGLYHQRRMFGGSLPAAWVLAAMTLHYQRGFAERFSAAFVSGWPDAESSSANRSPTARASRSRSTRPGCGSQPTN